MASSSSGKKSGLLIGGIVILAVAAYGGMRYVESKVVNEVRATMATSLDGWKIEAGDIRFSLLDKTLVLRDVNAKGQYSGLDISATITEATLVDPNTELESPANKTKTDVPVVKSLNMRGMKVNVAQANLDLTTESLRMDNLRMDVKRYATLTETYGLPQTTARAQSFMLDQYVLDKIGVAITGTPHMAVSINQVTQKKLDRGNSDGGTIEGLTVLVENQPKLTLEKIVTGRSNTLDDKALGELEVLTAKLEKNADNEEDAFKVLGLIFAAPKPLIESFSIINMVSTDPAIPLSLKSLDYTNPSNRPYTASLGFNMVLPVALVPGLEQLGMLGYTTLDVSASSAIKWPAKETMQTSLSVSAKDMANFSTVVDLVTKPELFSGESLLQFDKALETYPPQLAGLEMSFDDKGLIARSAATAQMMAGLTPEAASTMLRTLLSAILTDYMSPQKANERLDVLMSFVNKPGKLTLKVAPKTPLTLEALVGVSGDEEFIVLEAVPGEKTLKELMPEQK